MAPSPSSKALGGGGLPVPHRVYQITKKLHNCRIMTPASARSDTITRGWILLSHSLDAAGSYRVMNVSVAGTTPWRILQD